MSTEFFDPEAQLARQRRISVWRWSLWYACLALGMLLFYVLLTPLWLGLRWAAWVAEFRTRRRRPVAAAGGSRRPT